MVGAHVGNDDADNESDSGVAVVNTGLESILTLELRAMRPDLHQSSIQHIVAAPDMSAFFDRLAPCVRERNPDRFRGDTP